MELCGRTEQKAPSPWPEPHFNSSQIKEILRGFDVAPIIPASLITQPLGAVFISLRSTSGYNFSLN